LELLFEISTEKAADILIPLASACNRKGLSWGCFFTNDGVKSLANRAIVELVAKAAKAVVCKHSWDQFMGDQPCPVELGSQTNNSAMVAEATRVVSL
jgi:hypothetical protein